MESADPPEKMDEKLKRENMQKSSFLCLSYILRAIRADRCRERRYADHIFIQIGPIGPLLQNAPFRSQIFKIFFATGGKWALTPHNQNPADVPGLKSDRISFRSSFSSETHASPFHARCGGSDLWRPDGERREHVPATLSRTTRGERLARRTISSKELRLEPVEKAARPRLQGWISS